MIPPANQSPIELNRAFVLLTGDAGEHLDPETRRLTATWAGTLRYWPDLLQRDCVVILGEAGAGKSTELRLAAERMRASGDVCFLVMLEQLAGRDLEACLGHADSQLLEEWTQKGPEGPVATFFLDSLDEARLQAETMAAALQALDRGTSGLKKRLRLVVSCRLTDWRPEQDFIELKQFGAGHRSEPHVVHLLPLDEVQTTRLAARHGLKDWQAFWNAVSAAGARPYLERPRDVEWLVRYWNEWARIGSYTDLLENNVLRKLEERVDRRSSLSLLQSRSGATALAGALVLARRRSIAIPGSASGPVESGKSLDPAKVLTGWTSSQLQELLLTALFDDATYGRARFHHRSVEEYLAAEWFQLLVDSGLPRRSIEEVFFPEEGGEVVVPLHLRPVVAWLARRDERIAEKLVAHCPDVLIGQGDPAALPVETRRRALRAYASRCREGKGVAPGLEEAALRRFACTELTDVVRSIMSDPEATLDIRLDMLSLIAAGRLAGCVEQSLDVAVAEREEASLRCAAIRAVGRAGDAASRRRLLQDLASSATIDPDVAGNLVRELFPDPLDVPGLFGILKKVAPQEPRVLSTLYLVLTHEVPQKIRPHLLLDVIKGLVDAIFEPPEPKAINRKTRGSSAWLLGSLAAFMAQSLAHGPRSREQVTQLAEILRELEHCEHELQLEVEGLNNLREILRSRPDVRQQLFWDMVHSRRQKTGREYLRERDLRRGLYGGDLSIDLKWLEEDAMTAPTPADRFVAFCAMLRLPASDAEVQTKTNALERVAQRLPDLRRRLERSRNQPVNLEESARSRYEEWEQQARRDKRKRKQAEDLEWLHKQTDHLRAGTALDALSFLCHKLKKWPSTDPMGWIKLVSEKWSPEIGWAVRDGLKQLWRKTPTTLPGPSESEPRPIDNDLQLAGVTLAVEDGLDVRTLKPDDLRQLALVSLRTNDRLPAWLNAICDVAPDIVREQFTPGLHRDLRSPTDDPVLRTLSLVRNSAPPVLAALKTVLLDFLEHEQPARPGALRVAVESLLLAPELDRERFRRVLSTHALARPVLPERHAIWFAGLSEVDADGAFSHLEELLHDLPPDQAQAVIEAIAAYMHRRSEWYSDVPLSLRKNLPALLRLTPLVHAHVRAVEGGHFGEAYVMEDKHHAAWFRRSVIAWICGFPAEEARAGLLILAADPRMAAEAAGLRLKSEELRAEAAGGAGWSTDVIRVWAERFQRAPTSASELFSMVLDRMDDIRLDVEQGDFSCRGLFSRMAKDLPEELLQKWLASELRNRSNGQYTVHREEEVDLHKETDVRVHRPGIIGPTCIELKVAENYSLADLENALRRQLVGQYLRDHSSRHGVLLLGSVGGKGCWLDHARLKLTLADLVSRLNKTAQEIVESESSVDALTVGSIDFRDPKAVRTVLGARASKKPASKTRRSSVSKPSKKSTKRAVRKPTRMKSK